MQYGITDVLTLLGSLGLFLYGMTLAGDHLQKAAGEQMRVLIAKLARPPRLGRPPSESKIKRPQL